MKFMNGQMPTRIINEISIFKGLKMLGDSEINELREEFDGVLNIDNLKIMKISEMKELKMKMKIKNKLEGNDLKMVSIIELRKLREEVKEVMWRYYSENKLNLSEDIGDFREEIIVELMKGGEVKEVFDCYGGVGMLKVG